MNRALSGQATNGEQQDLVYSADLSKEAKSKLTKLAAWVSDLNIS